MLPFAAMQAVYHNTGERQIVQVLNRGAVDDIPGDASVEVACVVDRSGAHPIRFGALPLAIRGLVQAVKAYESLTVQAAVEGSPAGRAPGADGAPARAVVHRSEDDAG